jgi:hypothetical protein
MSPLEKFIEFYTEFNNEKIGKIHDLYSTDVTFIDPVKGLEGIQELEKYFRNISKNLHKCNFEFFSISELDSQAYLSWKMHFSNSKLAKGKPLVVHGVSYIKFDSEKILYHRDYYDMGEMIYENVSPLSWIIKKIKKCL